MIKWNALYSDFKKIKDYHSGTGNNVSFWALTSEERDENGLPRNFIKSHFEFMDDFLRERPAVVPPQSCDFQRQPEDDPVYNGAVVDGIETTLNPNNPHIVVSDDDENIIDVEEQCIDADLPFENRRGGGWSTPSLESLHISGVPAQNCGRSSPAASHRQPLGSIGAHPAAKEALPGNESTPIEVTSESTGKKRKSSAIAGLAEATASGTKALVEFIDKIRDSTQAAEERQSKDLADVTEK